VAVLFEGEITGLLNADEIEIETLGLMMAGSRRSMAITH
jgi:hypothetical protein